MNTHVLHALDQRSWVSLVSPSTHTLVDGRSPLHARADLSPPAQREMIGEHGLHGPGLKHKGAPKKSTCGTYQT